MKIYQTRLGNLSTSVDVNGVLRRVQFLASDGVNGIFSTADEQLQRAMENNWPRSVPTHRYCVPPIFSNRVPASRTGHETISG